MKNLTSIELSELSCAIDSNNMLHKIMTANDIINIIDATKIPNKKVSANIVRMAKLSAQLTDMAKELNSLFYDSRNAETRKYQQENRMAELKKCAKIIADSGIIGVNITILMDGEKAEISRILKDRLTDMDIKQIERLWNSFNMMW